jgi:curved DNA-binding protein CbpA
VPAIVIEDEIMAAGKVVVLWSKRSRGSVFVRDEAGLALEQKKLVPVAIDDCHLPLGFRSIHTLRAANLDAITRDLLIACGVDAAAHDHRDAGAQPLERATPEDTGQNAETASGPADPATQKTSYETGAPGAAQSDAKSPFSDVFEEMFGDIFNTNAGTVGTAQKRGDDLRYNLTITLDEAYSGKTAEISVPARATRDDAGRATKDRNISIKIPPGVEEGTRIRLAGEGDSGHYGGKPGDLYVFLQVTPHEYFERDGADLHGRVPVPLPLAGLGGRSRCPRSAAA